MPTLHLHRHRQRGGLLRRASRCSWTARRRPGASIRCKVAEFLDGECEVQGDAGGEPAERPDASRALLPVHLYGHPCDLDPLLALARRYPLAVVEDSTEALGARYRGPPRSAPTALAGCLSFNGNKIITTGGGRHGADARRGDGRAGAPRSPPRRRARRARVHPRRDRVQLPAHATCRPRSGVAQLEQLDGFVEDKRETARATTRTPWRGSTASTRSREPPWARSTYWMSSVLLDPRAVGRRPRADPRPQRGRHPAASALASAAPAAGVPRARRPSGSSGGAAPRARRLAAVLGRDHARGARRTSWRS